MASLARSLLALAAVALLQTACADRPSCTTAYFGRLADPLDLPHIIVYELEPIHLNQGYNNVHIDDPFSNEDKTIKVIGEKIEACNQNDDKAPVVYQNSPDSLDDIVVGLGFCVSPPIDIEVRVKRIAIKRRF